MLESIPERHLRNRRALRVQERHQRAHPTARRRTARSPWPMRWRSARDAFFYRLGEKFWEIDEHNAAVDPALKGKSTLKDDLERFGFGAKTGVQLPFEWPAASPTTRSRRQLVDNKVLGKNEAPRLLVGDNVQVAIGQGLMAATPLQLANAYSTIANGGFLRQPTIVKNIFEPLVPDLSPGVADLSKAVVVPVLRRSRLQGSAGDAARHLPADHRRPQPRHQRGRVCASPASRTRRASTTPPPARSSSRPTRWIHADRRQDRHGTGRRQLPVERLVGVRRRSASTIHQPYTVVAYLEKSGLRLQGRRAGRQVHVHGARRQDR